MSNGTGYTARLLDDSEETQTGMVRTSIPIDEDEEVEGDGQIPTGAQPKSVASRGIGKAKKIVSGATGRVKKAQNYVKMDVKDSMMQAKKVKIIPSGEIRIEKEIDEDGDIFKETVELPENVLSALFLCVSSEIWSRFPRTMKILFLISVISALLVQWTTTVLVWKYLSENQSDEDKQSSSTQSLGTLCSTTMLFVYLLGRLRVTYKTWQCALPRLQQDFLGYFISIGLFGNMLLYLFLAQVSLISIDEQDNISDKVQAALAFFFICEVDEWFYVLFIQPFDVVDTEDFTIEDATTEEERNRAAAGENSVDVKWDLKARRGLKWFIFLVGATLWSVIYANSGLSSDFT